MKQCAHCGKEINISAIKCVACGAIVAKRGDVPKEVINGLKSVNSDLEKMFGEMLPAGEKIEVSCKKRFREIQQDLEPILKWIKKVIINILRPIGRILYGQNDKSMQSCPWCNYKFGFLTFSLEFRTTFGFNALRLSDAPQRFFPCPKCGKSIERETDIEATKLAARKTAWLFLIPFAVWFFMNRINHASSITIAVVVISLAITCIILFGSITDYKGQILKKSE